MEKKYIEIAKIIRSMIDSGIYKPGEYLPGRLCLASEFNVARTTIDKCIELLVSSGVLVSEQGSGTYVNKTGHLADYKVALISWKIEDTCAWTKYFGANMMLTTYDDLESRATRLKLDRFDGIIWDRPEEKHIGWLTELNGKMHHVLVNRIIDGFNCVSYDYKAAYREITAERIESVPDAALYFLNSKEYGLVGSYRESGFIEACKEKSVRYKIINMPDSFNKCIVSLEKEIKLKPGGKLIIISASWFPTGAVIDWVKGKKLKWKKDIYYSDFDNVSPVFVWGVKVTTYVQRNFLLGEAVELLSALLSGKKSGPAHKLIFPERINGDT